MRIFLCVRRVGECVCACGWVEEVGRVDMLISNCCILVSAIIGHTHCSGNTEKFNLRAII